MPVPDPKHSSHGPVRVLIHFVFRAAEEAGEQVRRELGEQHGDAITTDRTGQNRA